MKNQFLKFLSISLSGLLITSLSYSNELPSEISQKIISTNLNDTVTALSNFSSLLEKNIASLSELEKDSHPNCEKTANGLIAASLATTFISHGLNMRGIISEENPQFIASFTTMIGDIASVMCGDSLNKINAASKLKKLLSQVNSNPTTADDIMELSKIDVDNAADDLSDYSSVVSKLISVGFDILAFKHQGSREGTIALSLVSQFSGTVRFGNNMLTDVSIADIILELKKTNDSVKSRINELNSTANQ